MYKVQALVATVFTALSLSCVAVYAEDSQSAMIEQSFDQFERSLDNQSHDMERARQQAEKHAAQVAQQNNQANQDTENSANQAFQNGQQQMVDGGGAYNSQGFIWGAPWGQGAWPAGYVNAVNQINVANHAANCKPATNNAVNAVAE